ncbi:MAG: hypothetical protein ACRD2J_05675 [Thermoanaerobaculia bacterium]
MKRPAFIRIAGAAVLIGSGVMLAGYLWLALDTPRVLRQAGIDWPAANYVNLAVLLLLHLLGVIAGAGLVSFQRWAPIAAAAYPAGLFLHGSFWFLRRPRLDETILELLIYVVVLLAAWWFLLRPRSSALFHEHTLQPPG